ncbi:hypothetical protein ACDA63_01225 [Uliginosibacterium sp. sgz301328]|uniref:hypothetical protein n=1 Tax=Uliginosibacterium sp. sgz301328 TaxID=3243764 RepID=UPI00359D972A
MDKQFRIVFSGQLLAGFDAETVKQRTAERLNLTSAQAAQMFSGRRVTLKRNLDPALAQRYAAELRRIGLDASPVEDTLPAPVPAAAPPAQAPEPATPKAAPIDTNGEESFDPEKTLVASTAAVDAYLAQFPTREEAAVESTFTPPSLPARPAPAGSPSLVSAPAGAQLAALEAAVEAAVPPAIPAPEAVAAPAAPIEERDRSWLDAEPAPVKARRSLALPLMLLLALAAAAWWYLH